MIKCGECRNYAECNAELHCDLSPNETFPEMDEPCRAFRPKKSRIVGDIIGAIVLMAAIIAVMLIVSARVNAVYGTDFEKGEEIMVLEPEIKNPAREAHSGEEITLCYTEREAELIAKTLWGECRGVKSKMEQAAVAWCILNRVDDSRFGDTIEAVITSPYQFSGFRESNPVSTPLLELAKDVLERWLMEKNGVPDVGRVLPKEYVYFFGDMGVNYFQTEWQGKWAWAFDCVNPYEERKNER
jgi:hypothetical protein